MESCDWPFTAQKRMCGLNLPNPRLNYMIKAADDPYIELSRLTQGTGDLGLNAAQQRALGIGLTVVGALFCTAVICVVARLCGCSMPSRSSYTRGNSVSFNTYNETMISQPARNETPVTGSIYGPATTNAEELACYGNTPEDPPGYTATKDPAPLPFDRQYTL